jgi:hypothetical protein
MIQPIRFPIAQTGQDAARTGPTPARSAAGQTQPAPKSGNPPAANLNGAEKDMIDASFPPSPRMSLRLYGPARPIADAPASIGSRIDLLG